MSGPKSWRAIIYAAPGHLLLSEVEVYASSRFEKKSHAEAFAAAIVRSNHANGRRIACVKIRPSLHSPDIVADDVEVLH